MRSSFCEKGRVKLQNEDPRFNASVRRQETRNKSMKPFVARPAFFTKRRHQWFRVSSRLTKHLCKGFGFVLWTGLFYKRRPHWFRVSFRLIKRLSQVLPSVVWHYSSPRYQVLGLQIVNHYDQKVLQTKVFSWKIKINSTKTTSGLKQSIQQTATSAENWPVTVA